MIARFSRTRSSASSDPTRAPILLFGTVVILSTISRLGRCKPFSCDGSMGIRNKGASAGSVVNAQMVIEAVTSNRSS